MALAAAAAVLLAGWGLSGFYQVGAGERGEVTRFGALTVSAGPGLNYHLPAPIERVRTVSTTTVNTLDIGGLREPGEGESSESGEPGEAEPAGTQADAGPGELLQTSDGDIVAVAFAVRWRVADPVRYLFGSANPDGALKTAARSVMGELAAQTPVQQVMAARQGLQARAASKLQALMTAYGTGVAIVSVEIRSADPPPSVAGAFRDAVAAGQEAQLAADEANAYRTRTLGQARSDAARILADAQGQAQRAAAEARGQAAGFAALEAGYRAAPDATRRRLYLDTLRQILDHAGKIVVDAPKGTSIMLQPGMVRDPSAAPAAASPQAPLEKPKPAAGASAP